MFIQLAVVSLSLVSSHSYLSEPLTRSRQAEIQKGCVTKGDPANDCSVCDPGAPGLNLQQAKRGDTINLRWPRNNHAYGFIRIAWAKMESSADPKAFESMIQEWTCHEMTCQSPNPADPIADDQDGPIGKCTHSIKVPSQIPDGKYTLQWVWVGGSNALGDYFSCVDYEITGGEPVSTEPMAIQAKFGDVHNPGTNQCTFKNANDVGICAVEPCTTGNMMGVNVGVPQYFIDNPEALLGNAAPITAKNSSVPVQPSPAKSLKPTAEEPTADEPTVDKPTADEPTIDEPTADEPTADETTENAQIASDKLINPLNVTEVVESKQIPDDFPIKVVSVSDNPYIATYILTFKDQVTRTFGAVLKIENGNFTISGWRVNFYFPNNMTIVQVFGADFEIEADGNIVVFSRKPQGPLQRSSVGIEGTF